MKQSLKIAGIYKISNKINNKIYIDSSFNISGRWSYHLNDLFKNIHCNKDLLDDFKKYGYNNFSFEIVEKIDTNDKHLLLTHEQNEINKYSSDILYNNYSSLLECKTYELTIDDFINFIKNRWLLPLHYKYDNILSHEIDTFKIWKTKDKDEIVSMAYKCHFIDLAKSHYSFNKVINTFKNYGFNIISGRQHLDKKDHTFKIIIVDK